MADYFNKKAYEATLDRMVEQRRIDKGGKGDTATELQGMKDQMLDIAKNASKRIENTVREKESGGKKIYGFQ